jgi:hypothetical protein
MFDNSLYRFPTTLVHKVAWIVYWPCDISYVLLKKNKHF